MSTWWVKSTRRRSLPGRSMSPRNNRTTTRTRLPSLSSRSSSFWFPWQSWAWLLPLGCTPSRSLLSFVAHLPLPPSRLYESNLSNKLARVL
uniref:Uncharacterized protein n=1 Tax=Zea mays TaxID=4577 RepID=C0P2Q2_MAIZE|nr:unknown [Zea mays]